MDILRFKPRAYWKLDNTSPFTDYAGYSKSAILTGTEQRGTSLTSNCEYSQYLDANRLITFNYSPFSNDRVFNSFSLAATVCPVYPTQDMEAQEYRENIATNPSFEHATTYVSNPLTTSVNTFDTTMFTHGTRSMKFVRDAATPSATIAGPYVGHVTKTSVGAILVTYGLTYSTGTLVRANVDCEARLGQIGRNAASAGTGTVYSTYQPIVANTWTVIKHENWTPLGETTDHVSTRVEFRLTSGVTVGGETVWIDGLMFNEGPTVQSYLDGSMPGMEWSGTANNSVSRTRTNISKVNLLENPSLESNGLAVGGSTNNGAVYPITADTTYKLSGLRSLRSTKTPGSTATRSVCSAYSVGSGSVSIQKAFPGETFVFSVHVRPGQAQYEATAGMYWYNSAGGLITSQYGSWTPIVDSTWNRIYGAVTAPAGTAGYRTLLEVRKVSGAGNAADNDFVSFDNAMLTRGSELTDYFDGASPGAAWSVNVNTSPSYMLVSEGEQQILSSPGQMDGLTIEGNEISFTTIHKNSGEARCSYTLDYPKRVSLIGVHTPVKNSLYIDGELVAEVDLTSEQRLDSYLTTPATMVSGQTYSAQGLMANELAIFESALDGNAAKIIYDDQTRANVIDIPAVFGGEKISLSTALRNPALSYVWKESGHWDKAMQVNCITDEDLLIPETRNGLSVDAQWLTSVNMYNGATVLNVSEINVDYSGYGATVSISLDGVNWTVTNGSTVQNFNPYKKDLYVKVDFAAGLEDAYLDNLTINAFTTNVATTKSDRTITYNAPTTVLREYPVQELHSKWGVKIETGGSVSIASADVATFETWFKPSVAVTNWTAFSYGSGDHYINGVSAGQTTLNPGQWYLIHVVPAAATVANNPLVLNAPGTYGQVAVYKTKLTATQVANIYREYSGPITTTVSDSTTLTVTQPAAPALIYGTDYAVIAGSQ